MVESDDNLEGLKELIQNVQESEKTPEIIEWMKEICAKEYGLIDSLILTFMDSLTEIEFANSVLRCLKILNEYCKDLVLPQMRENTNFPKAIANYLSKTKLKDLEGDGFILLVEIFQTSAFKDVTSDAFVEALFESLEYIKDEKVFLCIVHILISISYDEPSLDKNLVLKYAAEHKSARYFAEALLLLLNKGKMTILVKTLKLIDNIFENEKTKESFFYTNDLKALVDILVREISNTSSDEIRMMYLNILPGLLNTKEYQTSKHRAEDIKQMCDDLAFSEEISEDCRKKVDQILELGVL